MGLADWIILTAYLGGTVFIGVFLGKIVKNASDMFAAGGRSPWWLSGLSAFMTMFSANTFVVWGGIAYEHGLVAIVINICYGIAALLAGYTVAGKWKKLGIETPADYIEKRFGRGAVHFYTWFMMVFRLVGTGAALYAIARLTVAVIAGENSAGEGALSSSQLNVAILVFAVIVVAYTMIGGLWAVLVTDMLQFIILNLAVIFVIPLAIAQVGGLDTIINQAPEGFFSLTEPLSDSGAKYTWIFLMGWIAIHYFMIGAEWAFVQRYLCVPSEKDARKSTYLFGVLYLFSPFLWLLPPLLWRIQQPIPADADSETVTKMAETAYILSCKAVLPNGMLGLMLAALFSATASMISTQLNVFSGVLTNNIYKPLVQNPGEDQLVKMGRIFTCLLGCCIAAIAIIMPYMGGAAVVIISIAELMVTPILAPTLFAMYFKKLDSKAIWITVGICFPLGLMGRFLPALQDSFIRNTTFTGVILPVLIVGVLALLARREAPGWDRIRQSQKLAESVQQLEANSMPALIVSVGLGLCAITLFALIFVNDRDRGLLAGFGVTLTILSFGMYRMYRRMNR
jgi:SSS family transporter